MSDIAKVPSQLAEVISGDRPIDDANDDRLGFAPLARRLASALINQSSVEGLVVGLEGRWGSGKSSLLNLTSRAFSELQDEIRPVIVEFKPWLIGDRNALLAAFFDQLVAEIEKLELQGGDSARYNKRQRDELAEHLRSYADKAEVLGSILEAIPVAGFAGKMIKAGASALKKRKSGPTLLQLKRGLDLSLSKLPRRVIVTIDDVDRLEPQEVVELLRLVRSVADFQNVIYVLCYDSDILAKSIRAGLGIQDGHAYLEKIIQVSVAVPIPEPFRLRRWFAADVAKFATTNDENANQRLASVIDREGARRLNTPRAVVRALNALTLLIPSLHGEVDLPDLVWLQLVKAGNHKLYRWIEEYCAGAAANTSWRVNLSDEEKKRAFQELSERLGEDQISFNGYRYELDEHLPGIKDRAFGEKADEVPIYGKVSSPEIERSIADKRLASPDHYRLYFALAQPLLAPRADDYTALLDAATASSGSVGALFLEWGRLSDPTVGTKADVMLDRICQRAAETLSPEQAENILLALADVMDEVGQRSGNDDFGTPAIWREAERTIPALHTAIGARAPDVTALAFKEGRALGWLTSLLRHETFGHGLFGERLTREADWLFGEAEFGTIVAIMLQRYRSMTFEEFCAMPSMLSALFAWLQAGDAEGPTRLLREATREDADLLQALEQMGNLVRSSAGNYVALSRTNIEPFLDFNQVEQRVHQIAAGGDPSLKARAMELSKRFRSEDDF